MKTYGLKDLPLLENYLRVLRREAYKVRGIGELSPQSENYRVHPKDIEYYKEEIGWAKKIIDIILRYN